MTPAAISFDRCSPKVKFRSRRLFGTEQEKIAGVRRTSKIRANHKRTSQVSCISAETFHDEDNFPRKRQCLLFPNLTNCKHNTSNKFIVDSHIEVSDEDGDNYSSLPGDVKKAKHHSVQRLHGLFKADYSLEVENPRLDETTLGDGNDLLEECNARNFYIVKNDGRPSEMFSTDYFDKMRKGVNANLDSDDECIPGSGLIRMTDRWRAEWSSGIQVPLRPSYFSNSQLRKTIASRDFSCNASIQHKRREIIKKFFAEPNGCPVLKPVRLYECTALDKQWLKFMNERLSGMMKPQLSMEVFLEIMNDFEIQCYKNIHRKLLEPLHSPSSRVHVKDDDAVCDICHCDCEPDDDMVFCDGCNVCVHMSCYGLLELPPNEWLCMKCQLHSGRDPLCILCPTKGGALKSVAGSNQWAHVVCALWIPECRFLDVERREGISCINEIKDERLTAKCAICDTRQGACIKCIVDTCKIWFHATCASRSGWEMVIEQNDPNDEQVNMISLCPIHRRGKTSRKGVKKYERNQTSDEETDGLYSIRLLRKLERRCYLYVSHEETAARLNEDPSIVDAVFEFWRRKRLDISNGKALIDNLQDKIMISEPDTPLLELPIRAVVTSTSAPPATQMKRSRGRPRKCPLESLNNLKSDLEKQSVSTNKKETDIMLSRLLCSLEKGRDLVDLVVHRCQIKRSFMFVHLEAVMVILDRISRPVPLSRRKIDYLCGTLEDVFLCPKNLLDEAKKKAKGISYVKDSICFQTNSDASLYDSFPSSKSAIQLNRSRLRHVPRSRRKQKEKCDETSGALFSESSYSSKSATELSRPHLRRVLRSRAKQEEKHDNGELFCESSSSSKPGIELCCPRSRRMLRSRTKREVKYDESSDILFYEPSSVSRSPVEKSRQRLRRMPRSQRKREEKCNENNGKLSYESSASKSAVVSCPPRLRPMPRLRIKQEENCNQNTAFFFESSSPSVSSIEESRPRSLNKPRSRIKHEEKYDENNGEFFYESSSASKSAVELSPSRLRHMPRSLIKQEEICDERSDTLFFELPSALKSAVESIPPRLRHLPKFQIKQEEKCDENSVELLPEPYSASKSAIELSPPRLRHMPRSQIKQEEKCDEILSKLSHRSQLNNLSQMKLNDSVSQELKEQGNIRRRSLRSWRGKPSENNEDNTILESIAQTEDRNRLMYARHLRSPMCNQNVCLDNSVNHEASADETAINLVRNSIESSIGHSVDSFAKCSPFLNKNKEIGVRRRSESRTAIGKRQSPLRKRRETVKGTSSAEMRFLKSLNMKDFNEDSKQCLREFTIDGINVVKELRVFRPFSFPSMLRRDHVFNTTLFGPKSGVRRAVQRRTVKGS